MSNLNASLNVPKRQLTVRVLGADPATKYDIAPKREGDVLTVRVTATPRNGEPRVDTPTLRTKFSKKVSYVLVIDVDGRTFFESGKLN